MKGIFLGAFYHINNIAVTVTTTFWNGCGRWQKMTLAHEITLSKLCAHAVYIITAIRRGDYLICSKIRSLIQVEYILKNGFSDTRRFIYMIICCWLVCSAHSCWYIRPLNQDRTLDSLMLIARCSPEPITLCPIRLILDLPVMI